VGLNLIFSNNRWKWCQSHTRSFNVTNPGLFTKISIGSQMGHTKTFFLNRPIVFVSKGKILQKREGDKLAFQISKIGNGEKTEIEEIFLHS